jgi:hypothetical protein
MCQVSRDRISQRGQSEGNVAVGPDERADIPDGVSERLLGENGARGWRRDRELDDVVARIAQTAHHRALDHGRGSISLLREVIDAARDVRPAAPPTRDETVVAQPVVGSHDRAAAEGQQPSEISLGRKAVPGTELVARDGRSERVR